jgi:4-carboxymuconolactone decarboxylase
MGELDRREREFVALGAALASNCLPCIEYHIREAGKAGLTREQILEAVELADTVRQVPAQQVLGKAHALLEVTEGDRADSAPDCGCG